MLDIVATGATLVRGLEAAFHNSHQPQRILMVPSRYAFVGHAALTILLFASTPTYTGPSATWLDGTDIGYFVGFF